MVIEAIYDHAYSFADGQAPIRLNGRWGFIDRKGKFIIQPTYESPELWGFDGFFEGLAVFVEIEDNGEYRFNFGFIDKSWKIVIPPVYDFAQNFSGGISKVSFKGKRGYIDKKGTQYWED